jgi:hypothetical protein
MSSSSSNPNISFLRFQDLFNAALREYSQKTGKDIATEPLATRFLHCDSSDAVLEILKEQARGFKLFRQGDWIMRLMKWLEPVVNILFGLSTSGVFGEGVGLVRPTKSAYPLRKVIIHPAEISSSEGNICWCWSPTCSKYPFACLSVSAIFTPIS